MRRMAACPDRPCLVATAPASFAGSARLLDHSIKADASGRIPEVFLLLWAPEEDLVLHHEEVSIKGKTNDP